MQFGFVIDHGRCIGCHACTVACKSENEVPVGSFRTWVKQVEAGTFPAVRRSFAVLRCNQCSAAPCVTICPVRALEKRPDGIVDVDPARCIGCKSCLQACPYDALYIHPETGTAEKCHFCAHRVEQGLAPACAIVCPTEAIIPGDFDDPTSRVARLRAAGGVSFRKTEAGTGPNVGYIEAPPRVLDPGLATTGHGFLWAHVKQGLQQEAEVARAEADPSLARTTYDVQRDAPWGWKVWTYLFTKSLAAGLPLVAFALLLLDAGGVAGRRALVVTAAVALVALGATLALLVADLARPARFLFILLKPQWSSWLVRGAVVLGLYGAALLALLVLPSWPWPMVLVATPLAVLAAIYAAFLFGQAKGRVLWMRRGLALHLLVQAWLAGAAAAVLLGPLVVVPGAKADAALSIALVLGLAAHALLLVHEGQRSAAPRGREAEYLRTVALWHGRGPLARTHVVGVWIVGVALPLVLLGMDRLLDLSALRLAAAALALLGLFQAERQFVRAGQALPIH